jgi:ATP-dependent helicase STH1/SNF2
MLLPLDQKDFRRPRRQMLRDARMAETFERKQHAECERHVKAKHLEQLATICTQGHELLATNRSQEGCMLELGCTVQTLHSRTEKEGTNRIERISQGRLGALKADDDEAYMKPIDTPDGLVSQLDCADGHGATKRRCPWQDELESC